MATVEAEDFIGASSSPLMAPVKTRTGWLAALLPTAPHQALGSLDTLKGQTGALLPAYEMQSISSRMLRAPPRGPDVPTTHEDAGAV